MPSRLQIKTHKVVNIPEYLNFVEICTKEWFVEEITWGPWFRGQLDADWPLRPGLYRRKPLKRNLRTIEDEIRQEFAVRAPSLGPERPTNSWEWYFLMQHSGAPTRLMDWTESALIGLFFAVKNRNEKDKRDAAVWILEPWQLNKFVTGVAEVIAPGDESEMEPSDVKRYKAWLPTRYSVPGSLEQASPIAIYPTHFSRRISSQRSCFTIHGNDPDGFENLPTGFGQYLRKVIIPGNCVHNIETSLSVAGIDELSIFPDLDGLGRWLNSIWQEESEETPIAKRI
jgi:hypothetical protein